MEVRPQAEIEEEWEGNLPKIHGLYKRTCQILNYILNQAQMVCIYHRNLENASNAFFEEDHPDLFPPEPLPIPVPPKKGSLDDFVNKYTGIFVSSSW